MSEKQSAFLRELDITKPFHGSVWVSPEDAALALGINLGNRRKRPAFVDFLVRQIKNDEWQSDHPQPIVFSSKGRLIDGQHRLHAINEAKATVLCTVTCGARDELREYLDTGKSRGLEDRVEFIPSNHEMNRTASQVVTSWWSLCKMSGKQPTPQQAAELFNQHRDAILVACEFCRTKAKGLTRASVMVALCQMAERNHDMAVEFSNALRRPDSDIQQACMLRDFLVRQNGSGAAAAKEIYHKSIGCMKAYLEGRPVKKVVASSWES